MSAAHFQPIAVRPSSPLSPSPEPDSVISWLDLVSRYAFSGAVETTIALSELASHAPREQAHGNEPLKKVIEAVEQLIRDQRLFNPELLPLTTTALVYLHRTAVRSPEYSGIRELFTPSPHPEQEAKRREDPSSEQSRS